MGYCTELYCEGVKMGRATKRFQIFNSYVKIKVIPLGDSTHFETPTG